MSRVELIRITEHIHPADFSVSYLCQFAVDGRKCVPFWSHRIDREQLGEDAWFASLKENAEQLVREGNTDG
jgi:hypothetical protein